MPAPRPLTALATIPVALALLAPSTALAAGSHHRPARKHHAHRRHHRGLAASAAAPTLTASGDTLHWNQIAGATGWVLATTRAGSTSYSWVWNRTSDTPPTARGSAVTYRIRLGGGPHPYSNAVTITYPATTKVPTTPTTPTSTPTTTTTSSGADPDASPFAATSVWNAPLGGNAALDPMSSTYVSDLLTQVNQAPLAFNTTTYSTPVFTVPANQPTVSVTLDGSSSQLQQSWEAVPIPSNAQAAAGSDEHMVVYQPSTNTMWEFWEMHRVNGVWNAGWGGTMTNVSTNPGYFTSPNYWGATATSLPLLGGLVTTQELNDGKIDHALALAIPSARSGVYAWPAQRTDGNSSSSTAIPEGQRFRLDPSFDTSTISSPLVRMLAVAAQKYGMIVRDQSGSVSLYGEDTAAEGRANPYTGSGGWLQGQYASQLLQQFPWSHLEALQDQLN